MSGGWELPTEIALFEGVGALTASSAGTSITSSGSANTKGSWTQLIAATTRDAAFVVVNPILNGGASNISYGIDIGVGGAGSENPVITNFPAFFSPSQQVFAASAILPVRIPAGSRVSARCQSSGLSAAIGIVLQLGDSSLASADFAQIAEAVGFNTATTLGTAVDGGGTANTKGSYAQIVASAAATYRGFLVVIDTLNTTASALNGKLLDIAIGAAASEQVIVPNIAIALNNGVGNQPQVLGPFWVPIPEGTRLSARCQCSSNAADSRKLGITLMGLR